MPRIELLATIASLAERPSRRILVIGEPGVGKSTLVADAARQFTDTGVVVLRASPAFAERYTAYSMLWDLLARLDLSSLPSLPSEYRYFLQIALGQQPASTDLPSLAAAIALESILEECSASTPVVIVIDDLQWADAESLAAVERATRRLDRHPVYLLAASRDSPDTAGGTVGLAFDRRDLFPLGGLSVNELESVTRPHWPSTMTRAQVVALHEHTGGNPLWALEVIAGGHLGELGARPVGTLAAPPSLAVAIARRLQNLSEPAADVVSIVALLGHPRFELLASVLRFAEIDAAAVDEAEAAGFLVITTKTARAGHPLQASAAAARLTPARRRELHAFIAHAVPDVVVQAQHLQLSEPTGPREHIAVCLTAASVVMRQRGARLRSAHFAAQAVDRTDPRSEHYPDRLLSQAQQLFSAGDMAASLRALDRVSATLLDVHQYDAFIALSSSALAWNHGQDAVARFLESHVGTVSTDAVRTAIVQANAVADDLMTVSVRAAAAAAALAVLETADAPNATHRAIKGMIRAQLDGGGGLNHQLVDDSTRRQGIQLVVGLDDTGLATRGFHAHLIDDVAASRRDLAELVEWARSEGKDGVEGLFLAHAALVEVIGADVAATRRLMTESGHDIRSADLPASALPILGLEMLARGDHTGVAELIARGESSDLGTGLFRDVIAPALRGFSAFATEDWPGAVAHLRRAADCADRLELVELGSRFRVDLPLIEALIMNGENADAGIHLASVRAFLATRSRPISRIGLHRVTSMYLAASGDLTGAVAEAERAVDLAVAAGRLADEALSRLQRALVLTRLRRVTLGRNELSTAMERARQSDHADVCARVSARVSATRGGSGLSRSPSRLTASENRVLAAVLSGKTNREIAAELFVSVRTVESHVSAVLRKTGVASRSKLRKPPQ
ncbi:hypothetical protein GY21_18810 [Cryobacterium roopkundense]|nr:hypothetical protein GY21_18810 [Cryobacterium roopkundense]